MGDESPSGALRTIELLTGLRDDGWVVAVHNDYRQNGEPRTFWLFTHANRRWIKGEGINDEAALRSAVEESKRPDELARLRAENERTPQELKRAKDERHEAREALLAVMSELDHVRGELEAERAAHAVTREALAKANTLGDRLARRQNDLQARLGPRFNDDGTVNVADLRAELAAAREEIRLAQAQRACVLCPDQDDNDEAMGYCAKHGTEKRDQYDALEEALRQAEAELFTARARLQDGDAKNALTRLDAYAIAAPPAPAAPVQRPKQLCEHPDEMDMEMLLLSAAEWIDDCDAMARDGQLADGSGCGWPALTAELRKRADPSSAAAATLRAVTQPTEKETQMEKLTETVTKTVEVPSHIADLVNFAKRVSAPTMTDAELVAEARQFWDEQHGED